ncbi:MAG: hypothetical protein E7255_08380 [Lachnospiraceae bacterium]|jgi:HPt (histidine-containing phosphotransfer) domain-containing protein|nr:hypothetical protein [Lachnospiraceae bacterium]
MDRVAAREIFRYAPEIDFNFGYKFFLGNMTNYKQALLAILKSIRSKLPLLQAMLVTKEYEGLRTITRTLRQMLNHIGANEISEQSYQLEIALLNEEEYNLQDKLERYIKRLIRFTGNLEILIKQLDIQEPIQKQEELKSFRNHDFTKTRESIRRSTDLLERRII